MTFERPPQIRITCPENSSSTRAKITQTDGSELPGLYTKAKVCIDWETGEAPTVDLELRGIMPQLDIAADINTITLNGRTFRLVECDHVRPLPDNSAPELHD